MKKEIYELITMAFCIILIDISLNSELAVEIASDILMLVRFIAILMIVLIIDNK